MTSRDRKRLAKKRALKLLEWIENCMFSRKPKCFCLKHCTDTLLLLAKDLSQGERHDAR